MSNVYPKVGAMETAASARRGYRMGVLLISFAIVVAFILRGVTVAQSRIVMKKRVADVATLTALYTEMKLRGVEITGISDLIEELDRRHVALQNPLAVELGKPCYDIGAGADRATTVHDASVVIIQENDNVRDNRYIVRSYVDGSVAVQKK